jgi:3',5'-cyclic AMP phosphodiesterase CpdA
VAFVIAHVSDLHVSTFGDTFHDRARIVRRSTHPADASTTAWEVVWEEAGWRVLRSIGKRRRKLAIIDPEGYAHSPPGKQDDKLDPVENAASKACRLEARRAKTLAAGWPNEGALELLAQTTPKNSNVRLLRAVRVVEQAEPDAVVITGDLTDDGDGYELVEAAFAKWKEKKMLFVIPGNHDRYLFPLGGSGRPRPTAESKKAAWQALAGRLGLDLDPTGAWFRELPEADAVVVGFDSCARPQRRFFRHNGAIGPEQLEYLRKLSETDEWKRARHRIALLHHHVVPLPHGVGRRAPSEIGMRLDDAKGAAEAFNAAGVTLVMHGHRHLSEERQPAGCKFRLLSAPSLTLGCRSGDGPSFWRVELGEVVHAVRVPVPLDAIDQDEDDSEAPPSSSSLPSV